MRQLGESRETGPNLSDELRLNFFSLSLFSFHSFPFLLSVSLSLFIFHLLTLYPFLGPKCPDVWTSIASRLQAASALQAEPFHFDARP